MHHHFKFFFVNTGLMMAFLRPKHVANSRITIKHTYSCDRRSKLFYFILILYFKHNGMSSTKFCHPCNGFEKNNQPPNIQRPDRDLNSAIQDQGLRRQISTAVRT